MGEFWAPGAEIWLFKKKNMDRSIDLAVQHMQISNFRYAYSNMNLWGFLLTPAMYGQWTLCGVFCLKVALTYRSKNVGTYTDSGIKKTKSPNPRTRYSPVRYPNWFNSKFEFCAKLIQFNIQFKIILGKFNSKDYSNLDKSLLFNSIYYSINNYCLWFNSKDYSN